ncbi:synaptogyrin-3b isoform X2 [Ictalurus furcatus]|uniref:synaptogyrin-3b isoform X2 n=1 Tax=Ictalurus furcatus TaxID=66913 RepID=UPI0023509FE4|nr:synaptogyrin-3b isoform X2 [Ictalurus furcatus]
MVMLMMMNGTGSYGAGRTGSEFDPITFAKRPQTILRFLAWVFSMVVFGSIVNEGYVNMGSERLHCVFNKNEDACNYGIIIGVLAFLASLCFLALDVYFPQISSVKDRKRAVLLEMGFSGLWAFLWFVGFCFLANQWSRTSPKQLPLEQASDAARAAIAFSFFSILIWGYLCLLNMHRFKNIAFLEDNQRLLSRPPLTLALVSFLRFWHHCMLTIT